MDSLDSKAMRVVVPTPMVPRTLGLLNIIFGSLLILLGLYSAAQVLMAPFMQKMMESQQRQMEARIEAEAAAQREAQLETLAEEEKAATTDERKAAIEAERKAILSRPKPAVPDMSAAYSIYSNPSFQAVTWIQLVTGLILNTAMIASGIGLMRLKDWGRKAALWVAGIKLVRIAALLVPALLIVAPLMTKMYDQMFAQMAAQAQGSGGASQAETLRWLARMFGGGIAVVSVVGSLLAAIYPIIVLWLLNKPGARAACRIGTTQPGGMTVGEAP